MDQVKITIDNIVQEWAQDFITNVQRLAKSRIGTDTGEGAASFDIDVLKTTSSGAAMVIANFADYLRIFDMIHTKREKNLNEAALARVKAWIERKGVTNFLKGYKYPTQVREKGGRVVDVSTTRIINNIAWGISKSRKTRSKRIKWYNSKKGGDVYRLYAQLVDAVVVASMSEIKENIENKK